MFIILDANICIYWLRGLSERIALRASKLPAESILSASSISYAEVMLGVVRGADSVEKADQFFRTLRILPFDAAAARIYARLSFRRASFDRLIAAHALSLGATLVTANPRDFGEIPGLRIEDWTA